MYGLYNRSIDQEYLTGGEAPFSTERKKKLLSLYGQMNGLALVSCGANGANVVGALKDSVFH